ncbi:hypothetical protein Q0F98_08835 [Paenibacillus amylolyticus]|nr:hypothetical protein Q0F98_08835 [Paenibacillus amylolyticus]
MLHLLTPGRNETTPTDAKLDEFELLEQQWNELTSRSVTAHRQLQEQLPICETALSYNLYRGIYMPITSRISSSACVILDLSWRASSICWYRCILRGTATARQIWKPGHGISHFAAVNITQEVAKNYFRQISVMNFHDLSSAMLVIAPQDEPVKSQALLWGQELVEVIGRTLKMKVTLMVSRPAASLQELPGRFVEMEQAVAYRSVEEGSQILDLEDEACFHRNEATSYPGLTGTGVVTGGQAGQTSRSRTCAGTIHE